MAEYPAPPDLVDYFVDNPPQGMVEFLNDQRRWGDGLVRALEERDAQSSQLLITPTNRTTSRTPAVQAGLYPFFNVKDPDYGAIGNGVFVDTAAILAAIAAAKAAGGGIVFFPRGIYLFDDSLVISAADGVHLLGEGIDATILRASSSATFSNVEGIRVTSSGNWSISNLTVDMNENVSAHTAIGGDSTDDIKVFGCKIIKWAKFGVALNFARRFYIQDNTIELTTAINTQNEAILVSSASGTNEDGWILNNKCNKSGINVSAVNTNINGNRIKDWKFGAGVTTEQDTANSFGYTINDNRISGGTGTDINGTVVMGIENWGAFSTITNNKCWNNEGDGIDNGGHDSTLTGNVCWNNGQTAGSGIVTRYTSATFNGSNSVVAANRCFDTQGTKTQVYGYADESSSVSGMSLHGNEFRGHLTGMINSLGSGVSYVGPTISASVTWDPANITDGNAAQQGVTVAGARLGDFVKASFSNDIQGMLMTAWVNASNAAQARLQNETGGALDLASGTLRLTVEKPIDAADY